MERSTAFMRSGCNKTPKHSPSRSACRKPWPAANEHGRYLWFHRSHNCGGHFLRSIAFGLPRRTLVDLKCSGATAPFPEYPFFKPDVRISRVRLTDGLSCRVPATRCLLRGARWPSRLSE